VSSRDHSAWAADKDLRPAFAFGRHNIRAVNAFLEAAQYTYRDEHIKSIEPLRRALEIDPTFVTPRIWVISGLVNRNEMAEAERHYAYLRTLKDVNPFERALIGYAGAAIAHDPNAIAASLELALEYVPGNNIILVNLAQVRTLAGNCAGALDALQPVITMRWRYPPAYALWGICSITEGRLDAARRVLSGAVTLPHVYPSVYGFVEALALADGDAERARRQRVRLDQGFSQLDRQDKRDLVSAYDRLGSTVYQTGGADRAVPLFERAVDVDAQAAHPLLMLGTIYDARGDLAAAVRFYRAYVSVARGPDAVRVTERLRALDPSGAQTAPRERR
jgi:tetratricopeptide (TPR) repeat protein